MRPVDARRLLRWYPPAWRERYGDELIAMIEDQSGSDAPPRQLRLSLARAGLAQRLRDSGLTGTDVPRAVRIRGGALAILWAWTLFALAGCALAKTAEHWREATPHADRLLPSLALGVVQVLAVACAAGLALGALAVAAPTRRLVHEHWPALRPVIARAVALSALAVVVGVAVTVWAGSLDSTDRNGGDTRYAIAVIALACCVAAAALSWTAVATAAAQRAPTSSPAAAPIAPLALLIAGAMAAMLAATIVWWIAVADAAPRFLSGDAPGAAGSPWSPQLIAVVATMALACALALAGARRIVGAGPSHPELRVSRREP